MRRRVACRRGAGNVPGALGNTIHIGGGGAAVDGSDVASIQLFDTATKGFKQRRATFDMRRPHDHGLGPPYCQTGQRSFIAHVLGQADGVIHGTFIVGVGQISAPSQGGPQATAMNGNHRLEPRKRINTEVQRLHMSTLHESKH